MSLESRLLFIFLLFFLAGVGLFTDEDNNTNWIIASCIGLLGVIGAEISEVLI